MPQKLSAAKECLTELRWW